MRPDGTPNKLAESSRWRFLAEKYYRDAKIGTIYEGARCVVDRFLGSKS